jgi:hypothetical protein
VPPGAPLAPAPDSPTSYVTVLVAALPSASADVTVNEDVPADAVSSPWPEATGPSHVVTAERPSGSWQE